MLLTSPAEPTSDCKLGFLALALLALVIILWISECVSPAARAVLPTTLAVLGLILLLSATVWPAMGVL